MAMPGISLGNSMPQLGDGRAILLGEACREGIRRGIQLKVRVGLLTRAVAMDERPWVQYCA
jgi:hypothetical protein